MNLQIIVQLIVAGLITGSIYTLLGLGYNVIFSTTKVFNLAQGDFLMLGMMLGLFFIGNLKIPIIFAILIVCMIVALMGVLEERIAIRPVAKNPGSLSWVITTLSYALLLRNSAELIWGTEAFRFPVLFSLESFYLAGIRLVPQEIAIFSITVLIAVSLHMFFTATIYGKAFSAIAQDKDAARLRGINVQKMYVVAFSIGAAIAALGGIIVAPLSYAYVHIGMLYTFKGFIAVAIGGIGNIMGAVVGGLCLGLVESMGTHFLGAGYKNALALLFLITVFLIKPTGIFGIRQLRQV